MPQNHRAIIQSQRSLRFSGYYFQIQDQERPTPFPVAPNPPDHPGSPEKHPAMEEMAAFMEAPVYITGPAAHRGVI